MAGPFVRWRDFLTNCVIVMHHFHKLCYYADLGSLSNWYNFILWTPIVFPSLKWLLQSVGEIDGRAASEQGFLVCVFVLLSFLTLVCVFLSSFFSFLIYFESMLSCCLWDAINPFLTWGEELTKQNQAEVGRHTQTEGSRDMEKRPGKDTERQRQGQGGMWGMRLE